jgi:hypothetical protein
VRVRTDRRANDRARCDEGGGGLARLRDERVVDFLADFVGRRTRRGAEPRDDAIARRAHRVEGGFEDAACKAAPAGVRGRQFAAVAGGEDDGHAIGGEDRQDGAGGARQGGVGFGLVGAGFDGDVCAMDLAEPARWRREIEAFDEVAAVLFDRGCIVAAAQAEVEGVERRLRCAQAGAQRREGDEVRLHRPCGA